MNRGKLFLLIWIIVLLLSGCGQSEKERLQATVNAAVRKTQTAVAALFTPTPPPTLTPTITPDPGEMISKEFSISMPFNWTTYDFSGIGMNTATDMYRQGFQENPALECVDSDKGASITSQIKDGLRLVATGPTASLEHCVSLIIGRADPIDNMTLEEFSAEQAAQFPDAGNPEVKQKILNLNYAQAAEIIYEQPKYAVDSTEVVGNETYVYYLVMGPKGTYFIFFLTPSEEFKTNYANFTQIVQSFRLEE